MANRRMFSKEITESDAFQEMPLSAQCLYFHVAMSADDDGFCASAKRIQRTIGAADDDLKLLLAKRFLLSVGDGIIVLKHWRIHNYIPKDRYHKTVYTEQMAMLTVKDNRAYSLIEPSVPAGQKALDTSCIQDGYILDTQNRIDKNRLDKNKVGESSQAPTAPTLEEVKSYCSEKGYSFPAEKFFSYYASQGWKRNGTSITDWRSLCDYWQSTERDRSSNARIGSINEEYTGSW